mgnify:CR=1 FL=1
MKTINLKLRNKTLFFSNTFLEPLNLNLIDLELKKIIEKGGIVIFSNSMTANDTIIYNNLVAQKYKATNYTNLVVLSKVN